MTRIGIIGAGQLGQMLGFAGRSLGLSFIFLDPAPNPPAAAAGRIISSPFDDKTGLLELAAAADIVTYEFENVPVTSVATLAEQVPVYPPPAALQHAQDRLAEKQLFTELEIPIPAYRAVDTEQDLHEALREIGTPLVLKTRRLGYDGKGQILLRSASDLEPAWRKLGGRPLIAEQWLHFEREVSAIGVRGLSGASANYPLTENRHRDGILRESRAPADPAKLAALANEYMEKLLKHLQYVGVLALELFVVDGRLLANEFAPRVHNSGHWTMDGAVTSQFENHLRAILDMAPGDTSALGYAGMVNLIGSMPKNRQSIADTPAVLHDYGKVPRPGRKLGHVNVIADTAELRESRMMDIARQLASR